VQLTNITKYVHVDIETATRPFKKIVNDKRAHKSTAIAMFLRKC
jgi:hypothetical protein